MDEPISKSQKKRDAERLQQIGNKLVELSETTLKKLPLTPVLYQAIMEAKSLKSHGAIRRQSQLIGKLMRDTDSDSIIKAYDELLAENSGQTAAFHELEQWRDRLVSGDKEAITEFINHYQPHDIQLFRQLVKKAIEEKTQQPLKKSASTTLFRFLRSCL